MVKTVEPENGGTSTAKRSETHESKGFMKKLISHRKKAVVVGINYKHTNQFRLMGCVNDANAFALTLINVLEFDSNNIMLLTDDYPSDCYLNRNDAQRKKDHVIDSRNLPTRQNILMALNWLTWDTKEGDVLVFYFAGHGVQIDDMSGWEGEGYDEAFVPVDMDFENPNPLSATQLKQTLLNVHPLSQLTTILDCNGGQTVLDPSGTGSFRYIKGLKQKGIWPFITNATNKVQRAKYDAKIWKDASMVRRQCKPRFVPGVDVSKASDLRHPTLSQNLGVPLSAKAFLLAAAPWGQCAIEGVLPSIGIRAIDSKCRVCTKLSTSKDVPVVHGLFTYCLVKAIQEIILSASKSQFKKMMPYKRLIEITRSKVSQAKREFGLKMIDQVPEVTFYSDPSASFNDYMCWPGGGSNLNYTTYSETSSPRRSPQQLLPSSKYFLTPLDADLRIRREAAKKRLNDPAFVGQRSAQESYQRSHQTAHPSTSNTHTSVSTPNLPHISAQDSFNSYSYEMMKNMNMNYEQFTANYENYRKWIENWAHSSLNSVKQNQHATSVYSKGYNYPESSVIHGYGLMS